MTAALLLSLGLLGLACGFRSDEADAAVEFRIVGASMSPTLNGQTLTARCDSCGLQWPVDAAAAPTFDNGICWHCGAVVTIDRGSHRPGDRVFVQRTRKYRRNQLVAYQNNGLPSVKRIVAVPGETIDLDGLELQVDGRAIDGQTMIPVDLDDHRAQSRWRPALRSPDRIWRLGSPTQRIGTQRIVTEPIVYHHRSVHDQDRPSPVYDDYPINIGLSRPLEPVDRLVIRGDVIEASADAALVVNFAAATAEVHPQTGQTLRVSSDDCDFSVGQSLGPESPVSIQLKRGSVTIARLSVYRPMLYRLRRRDDRSVYPITLGDDQYFVLGDNVPISIDSRDRGPIDASEIIGEVRIRTMP